jgi:hypothetical protein
VGDLLAARAVAIDSKHLAKEIKFGGPGILTGFSYCLSWE